MGKRGPTAGAKPSRQAPVFSFRLRPAVRERLEEIARNEGRTLSEVANQRLERSLSDEKDIENRFGGIENYRIVQLISIAIERANPADKGEWIHDAKAFDKTTRTIELLLAGIRPESPSTGNHFNDAARVASDIWMDVVNSAQENVLDRMRHIKADLANVIDRTNPYYMEFIERFNLRLSEYRRLQRERYRNREHEMPSPYGKSLEAVTEEVVLEMIAEGKAVDVERGNQIYG